MPSSMRMRFAASSADTFPYAASGTAAVLTPGSYDTLPGSPWSARRLVRPARWDVTPEWTPTSTEPACHLNGTS
jgi:hypothetical protein